MNQGWHARVTSHVTRETESAIARVEVSVHHRPLSTCVDGVQYIAIRVRKNLQPKPAISDV